MIREESVHKQKAELIAKTRVDTMAGVQLKGKIEALKDKKTNKSIV